MALHSLYCADVPWRNCSLTHLTEVIFTVILLVVTVVCSFCYFSPVYWLLS